AKKESIEAILRLAQYKETGRCRLLIVAGCLTQRYKDELAKEMPEVDFFIGTGEYPKIADIIRNGSKEKVIAGIPQYVHDHDTPRILATPRYSAYQDSTSYGMDRGDSTGLEQLLKHAVKINGIEWVRLLYLYPIRITRNLIRLIRDEEKICKYIDMPIQHINNRILRAMNRSHTKTQIEDIIKMIRQEMPGAALRTSLIVGFPGETEEEFEELLDFVKETRFDRLGAFKYSQEEDTPAHKMKGQIPENVKKDRLKKIMKAQAKIAKEKNRSLMGSMQRVLVEGLSDETEFLLKGRATAQAPDNIDGVTYINKGMASPGDIVDVLITDAGDYDMAGEIAERALLAPG
ncbi:MAG: radical SAM protein, partial [Deltaproteobacteria bacterium]|nr:radical SAM protein [Deltaproteobacteria bacterium]